MGDKKTIREMAEQLGVSKTAIRKKMAVLFANDTGNQLAETVSGIIYISVSGQKLLVEAFSHNQRKPVPGEVSDKLLETGSQLSETKCEPVSSEVSSFELVIKTLQEQLSVKDSQLAEKDKQIEHLQTALAQEQAALGREQENVKLAQQLHGADKVQQALSISSDAVADGEPAAECENGSDVGKGVEVGNRSDVGKRSKVFRWPWSRKE